MKCIDLKFYLPAKEYALSNQFYTALGFAKKWEVGDVTAYERDGFRFLLQDFYLPEHAKNYMVHLLVDDVNAWFEHAKKVVSCPEFSDASITEPKMQPWGIVTAFLKDPSGVLWHIAEQPKGQ